MKRLFAAWCVSIAAAAVAVPAALILPQPACADSWMSPETIVTLSPSGRCRLTVTPGEPSSPTGQPPGGRRVPNAVLEQRTPDGSWHSIWRRDLINEIAPTDSYVSASGRYVVTLDNWYSTGFGDDAIVIYDTHRGTVRHFGLRAMLGEPYFLTLPRSVSSIQWRENARILGEALIVPVATPDDRRTVEFAIDLARGTAAPLDSHGWQMAQKEAEPILAHIRAAEAEQRAPLRAPATNDERDWHRYLAEAYFRLTPGPHNSYPNISFLPVPTAPDYAESLGWLVGALREMPGQTHLLASPAPLNLANVLVAEAGTFRPGALRGTTIYVAIGPDLWPRIRAAFSATGAELIRIDTATPIPQRPERMPDPRQPLDD
jgi:hypothetical protein